MMEDIITDSNINSLDSALDNAINNTNDWVQETEGDHPEGEADGDVDVESGPRSALAAGERGTLSLDLVFGSSQLSSGGVSGGFGGVGRVGEGGVMGGAIGGGTGGVCAPCASAHRWLARARLEAVQGAIPGLFGLE